MSQHPLYVMILWHMHQPYYKDVNNQQYLMPWVGLHATKDYLDMPLLAAEYPELRVTFNMVPSLLDQVREYAAGTAHDPYLALANKRAEDLDETERVELLRTFFMAHYERMIKPYPRYMQLHERRGWSEDIADLRRAAQQFTPTELRDLQVWFYLTWIDPYLRERDPRLCALISKERLFSEEDKHELLGITRELAGRIIPTLAELWKRGQIEVSTTPFFHPILPLLVDTDIARRPRPKVALPTRRFQHPEDAQRQIDIGLDYCEQLFGKRPAGMWPSEGSVCPEIVPMFKQAGVRWIATDEDVLASSLGIDRFLRDRNGIPDNPDGLYRPYTMNHDGAEVALFFRDHFLSDLLGFKYAHWSPFDAASDLVHRLDQIEEKLSGSPDPHVVSIILDGENCWEHYEKDGEPFLRHLYMSLTANKQLKTVTPSDYLDIVKEHRRLDQLHSGSWINRDFQIWLGHPEDNASWDLLGQARDDIGQRLRTATPEELPEEARQRAMKSILIAEGSDWNWWYGDENNSGFDELFDALYRQHLRNAYEAVGLEAPGRLYLPITKPRDSGLQILPSAFLNPTIDGRVSSYFEWFSAGLFDPRRGGDSMHQSEYIIEGLYFGFDPETFFLRIDLNKTFRAAHAQAGTGAELAIYIFTERNYRIVIPLGSGAGRRDVTIYRENTEGWQAVTLELKSASGVIAELALPFTEFTITPNQMLRFQAAIEVEGRELERCPGRAPLSTEVPTPDFEEQMWIV